MSKVKLRTLAAFKAEFDPSVKVPEMIRAALKSLAAEGQEAWEFDKEFVARCGTNYASMTPYLEQFADHIVMISTRNKKVRVWFADKKVAAKARGK